MVATSTIGHWRVVVGVIVRLSPITAALLLGFTTNFAPRMVYRLVYQGSGGRGGKGGGASSSSSFVRFALSTWRLRDFAPEVAPNLKDDAIRNSTLHVQAFRKKMNLTEDVCFYQVVYQELYIADSKNR